MERFFPKMRQGAWALTLAAVVLSPSFRSADYKTYAVSLGFFALLLVAASGLFKKPEFPFSRLEIFLALYVGWSALSYSWSSTGLAASEYLGRFLPCVGLFLLVRLEGGDGSRLRPVWAALAGLACLYGLLQEAGLDFVAPYARDGSGGRVFSTFGNPNVYAAFLVLSGPILLLHPMGKRGTGWDKTLRTGLGLLLFSNLLLTRSRAGVLAMVLEAALFLFFLGGRAFRNPKTRPLLAASLVLALLGAGITAWKSGLRPTERLQVWEGAARMAAARPLEGWGVGQFSLNFGPYVTPELAARMREDNTFTEHAHNEVLEMLVELGLAGLGLAGLFWGTLAGRGAAELARSRSSGAPDWPAFLGPVLGLAGVGLTNLFDYNCRLSGVAFFIWVSAAILANQVYPADRWRVPGWTGKFLAAVLAAGALLGVFRTLPPMVSLLQSNPKEDFLKTLPPNPSEAERKIRDEIRAEPGNSTPYHELGNLYARLGRMEDAKRAFEKELKLDPRSAGAYLNLGNLYFLEAGDDPRDLDKALECYRKSLDLDPNSVDGRFNMAYVYFVKKDLKDALAQLQEVLKRDPQNAKALSLKRQILP